MHSLLYRFDEVGAQKWKDISEFNYLRITVQSTLNSCHRGVHKKTNVTPATVMYPENFATAYHYFKCGVWTEAHETNS
jgi:hypothetical protein